MAERSSRGLVRVLLLGAVAGLVGILLAALPVVAQAAPLVAAKHTRVGVVARSAALSAATYDCTQYGHPSGSAIFMPPTTGGANDAHFQAYLARMSAIVGCMNVKQALGDLEARIGEWDGSAYPGTSVNGQLKALRDEVTSVSAKLDKLDTLHEDLTAVVNAIEANGNADAAGRPVILTNPNDVADPVVQAAGVQGDLGHADMWWMGGLIAGLAFGFALYRVVMPRV